MMRGCRQLCKFSKVFFRSDQLCSDRVRQISTGLRSSGAVLMEAKSQKQTSKMDQQGGANVTKTVSKTIRSCYRNDIRSARRRALRARRLRAGKLSIGFWDHWVPGANKTLTDLVNEWAEKAKVEVRIDYITSQGNKLLVTVAAEAQAKTGHDILAMATWLPHANAELLEPVND